MTTSTLGIVLAIGTRRGLWLARRDRAGRWALDGPHFLMQEVAALAFAPAVGGAGDAAGDGGVPRLLAGVRSDLRGPTMERSDDLGGTWHETDQGAVRFPEELGTAPTRIWQIQPDPARPGVVWAGCEPTSLWRSTDGGEHFTLVRSLWEHPHRGEWYPAAGGAALHTVLADPDDPDRLLVAMSTGGVYVTEDHAVSWQPRNRGIRSDLLAGDAEPEFGQCVHKVAADAGDPRRLYAQNHGGVYRSDDAGASWTSVADGLPCDFGFPLVTHPTRPGVAWVVPLVADDAQVAPAGRLRPHRTEDGGSSWKEVGAGMPDGQWNVVHRDAMCAVAAGPDPARATLLVGTGDGCVYAGDDDGDAMTEIARHLPGVLCLRAISVPA